MTRTTILARWIAGVLVDRPDILKSGDPIAAYAELQSEFMKDVQPAMKELADLVLSETERMEKK